MTLAPNSWLRVLSARESPKCRLICFPHSGGSSSAFSWTEALGESIEVISINPPGKTDRRSETPISDLTEYVQSIANALYDSGALVLPYAFFGHSFGAIAGAEVASLLQESGKCRRGPVHLFASSMAPLNSFDCDSSQVLISTCGDDDFIAHLSKWGFVPQELRDDESLREVVLPGLRADIHMYEQYRGVHNAIISSPVTVLYGKDDHSLDKSKLTDWSNVTHSDSDVTLVEYPGGHFYQESNPPIDVVRTEIENRLLELKPSIHYGGDALHLDIVNEKCVYELIYEQFQNNPDRIAIVEGNGEVTYSEMWSRVSLISSKIPSGATVGIMLPHSSDYICSMLAIWASHSCLLVLESHHPPEMLERVCSTCNSTGIPDVVITIEKLKGHFPESILNGCQMMFLDSIDNTTSIELNITPGESSSHLNDRAILMTTSGTSGLPKLIEGSQRFVTAGMLSRSEKLPYNDTIIEREACSVMFVWEVPRSLIAGHTCVVIPEATIIDPIKLIDFLVDNDCTRVLTTPSLAAHAVEFLGLSENEKLKNNFQSKLSHWLFMGEVVNSSIVRTFLETIPKVQAVNAYSTWEAADTALLLCSDEHLKPYSKFYPVGLLHEGVHAVVLDPITKKIVPRCTVGELYTAGPQLANGYSRAEELTKERYVEFDFTGQKMKWYKSGDAAIMFEDDIIQLLGRIDSTVKIRGFKVGLPFVEGLINDSSMIALSVVVPTFSSDTDQPDALVALLIPNSSYTGSFKTLVSDLRKEISPKMPAWAQPSFYLDIRQVIKGELMQGGEAKKINRSAIPKLFTKEIKELVRSTAGAQTTKTAVAIPKDGIQRVVADVWCAVLELTESSLDPDENFFELGGHSLMASTLTQKLSAATGIKITVLDLYDNSTLTSLINFVGTAMGSTIVDSSKLINKTASKKQKSFNSDIAIIGMSGRFPGADDIWSFFDNLKEGRTTPTFLSKDFLREKGISSEIVDHPDYTRVAYKINDADKFDAKFWGIGRTEASVMDPQHRVFIETAWNAVENSGYAPKAGLQAKPDSRVGVFASAGIDGYLVHHLKGGALNNPLEPGQLFMTEVASEKDYIATRVSYLMNLKGPSVNVNSACSSALVAISQACSAITVGECDMAIAGGAAINFPNMGYLYQDGLIYSKDGYVRPLDESAEGTAFGDSVGAVVLKRLEDAERDNDHIWGVIRGFGVSNDGSVKAGYAAPSAAGQSDCISKAHAMSEINPNDVSYIEMHATGTLVGDGIEAKGLTQSFRSKETPCAVGSVKGNIGHANGAAGITGFIKTVMMAKYKTLVPTANFSKLNKKVEFEGTPFFVNTETKEWQSDVRCAGVSSFGIGGTNAHIVLTNYDDKSTKKSQGADLLMFSAKSKESLKNTIRDLSEFLKNHGHYDNHNIHDIAYTLRTGRVVHPVRAAVLVKENQIIPQALSETVAMIDSSRIIKPASRSPIVTFMCPGQGSQYLGMAKGLYDDIPLFRETFDEVAEMFLFHEPDVDIRKKLFDSEMTSTQFNESPLNVQPSLFAVEYSIATLLIHVGIVPDSLAGHSIGEYVAAVLGGYISLKTAVNIVFIRATATMRVVPPGTMLSVGLSEELTLPYLENFDKLWIAAQNSPIHTVVSGDISQAKELEIKLKDDGIKAAILHVNRAFHSPMMEKAGEKLSELDITTIDDDTTKRIPVASNVTGSWISQPSEMNAEYWKKHMMQQVRWRDCCAATIRTVKPTVCIEVGPGSTLSTLSSRCCDGQEYKPAFEQSMRHARSDPTVSSDTNTMTSLLGRLWCIGIKVNWDLWNHQLYEGKVNNCRKVSLPGYAFEKTSFWKNPEASVYVEGRGAETTTSAPPSKVKDSHQISDGVRDEMLIRFLKQSGKGKKSKKTKKITQTLTAYCLPYAGGSARSYEKWGTEYLSAGLDIVALELPGRGARMSESLLSNDDTDIKEIDSLTSAIISDCAIHSRPYVLVGKSMGGLLTIELFTKLKKLSHSNPPLGVIIAGRAPVRKVSDIPDLSNIGPEELSDYSLAPDSLKSSDAWTSYFLPLLKSDLLLDMRTEIRLSRSISSSPFEIPQNLTLLSATSDSIFECSTAPQWFKNKCQKGLRPNHNIKYLPGGHDFLTNNSEEIAILAMQEAMQWIVKKKTDELLEYSKASISAAEDGDDNYDDDDDEDEILYNIEWENFPVTPVKGSVFTEMIVPASSTSTDVFEILKNSEKVILTYNQTDINSAEIAEKMCFSLIEAIQMYLQDENCLCKEISIQLPMTPYGGIISGMTKSIPFEIPDIEIKRLHYDDGCNPLSIRDASIIFNCAVNQHDVLVTSDGQYKTPKLKRIHNNDISNLTISDTPSVIIVTGWTGGLGTEVVNMLGQKLKKSKFILLSRSDKDLTDVPECIKERTVLSTYENMIEVMRLNLTSDSDLVGILHLAGFLQDGLVSNQTLEKMMKVTEPKVKLLERLLSSIPSDITIKYLIGFSSTSSLLGYPGQSNYCAANGFLDNMAQSKIHNRILKMTAISWGPWGEIGMARKGTKAYDVAVKEGDCPLQTKPALNCLAYVLKKLYNNEEVSSQYAVCDVDWEVSPWNVLPIVQGQGYFTEQSLNKTTKSISNDKESFSSKVSFWIANEVGRSSWSSIIDEDIASLGLDSLDVVQLRNAFVKEFKLSAPLSYFTKPNLTVLQLHSSLVNFEKKKN